MTATLHLSHRIERQVLELDLVMSSAEAPGLQDQAARLFRARALPRLEELFDRIAGPGRLLRLDRLEVDLGELRGPDWPEQLLARLADRLGESLAAASSAAPAADAEPPAGPLDAAGASLEQLRFFLLHGRLPWWGSRPAWDEEPAGGLAGKAWQALSALLRHDRRARRARRRLGQVAGDGFLSAAVAALAGLPGSERVLDLLAPPAIPAPAGAGGSSGAWRSRFWTQLLDVAVAGPPGADAGRGLLRRLLAERRAVAGESAARPAGAALSPGADTPRPPTGLPPLPAPWQGWLEAALAEASEAASPVSPAQRQVDAAPKPGPITAGAGQPEGVERYRQAGEPTPAAAVRTAAENPVASDGRSDLLPTGQPAAPAAASMPAERPADADRSAPRSAPLAAGEAVFLAGAGGVILHPFLAELFRRRGLLAAGARAQFRDEAARHHAVHLLGHLTFGGEAPEYDLLLPKLLCGLPWEELPAPAALDDDDRAACDELLAAVLGHWQALRSTSAAWLREQFFLREGKLEPVDQGWKLTVERRGQDVLLDRLPWGLGTVRLPWLAEVLHVRWTDR